MRSLPCVSPLAFPLDSLPFRFSPAERVFGGIQQLQCVPIEVAVSPGRHQVLVQGGYRGLSKSSAEGDLRILEVKLLRQHKIMLPLQRDDLVHHRECGSVVVVGEQPVHPHEMPVDQDLGRQLSGHRCLSGGLTVRSGTGWGGRAGHQGQ